jgi:hypothetical protein
MSSPARGLPKPKQKPKGRSANDFVERNFTRVEKLSNIRSLALTLFAIVPMQQKLNGFSLALVVYSQ